MSIRVELELDDGSFTTRMIHAGETVRQFQGNVNGTVQSIGRLNDANTTFMGTMRDVTIVLGLASIAFNNVKGVMTGWAGDIVKVNAEMERLKTLLAGMSRAADPVKDAAMQVKYLRDFAKDAPFALSALTDTFVKMKSTGIDPMSGALKGLVDGVAAFGGNDEALKRATIAITQMSGKGVIQMEELRQQLGEAMPRAVEIMARSMGVSMGQLIQEISKGTLDAKTSLAAFNMELDRSFGGAASAQMATFNGLISRTKTLMQNLALDVGEAGFFEAVKNQVKDLNHALTGDTFRSMAQAVGGALTTVVNSLGSAVKWVIEFRNELATAGEVLATVFGAKILAQISMGMVGLFQSMRAEMSLTMVQMTMLRNGFSGLGGVIMGVRSMSDAMTAVSLTGGALSRVLPLIGTGLVFLGGWVPLIVGAVSMLALAFGKTSDASKDAYENLAKYGAESRKQADEASKYLPRLAKEIETLKALKEAQTNDPANSLGGVWISDDDIRKLEDQYAKAQEVVGKGQKVGTARDADRFIADQNDALDVRMRALRKEVDAERTLASQKYTDDLKALNDANKDTTRLQEDYAKEKRRKDLEVYQAEKNAYAEQLIQLQMMANGGNETALAAQERYAAELQAKIADSQAKIETLTVMSLKPVSIDKGANVEKVLEQARAKLDNLNSTLASQRAELEGVSGEYAKMAYLIEDAVAKSNGMWTLNNDKVMAVVKSLKEAQKQSDELTEKITGQKQFDADLQAAEAKARQDYNAAVANGKTGLDAIAAKMQAGLYSGQTSIARMNGGVAGLVDVAKQAGTAMDGAFGDQIQNKGIGLLGIVEKLGAAWGNLRNKATGINPDDYKSMSLENSTYKPGSTYTQNVIRQESGGRADAASSTSSAVGLGQFIEDTWLKFLKEMHPDMLAAGRQAALDSRKDAALSTEAINWLASKNMSQLDKAGVPTSDANVYLAHMLGADGAISALTKSSDTMLSTIKTLEPALKSNPTLRGMNVGDLQKWAQSFMGPLSTASRSGANTDSLNTVLQGSTNAGQVQTALRTQQLEEETKRLTGDNKLADKMREAALAIAAAGDNQDGLNKRLATMRKLIADGEFGTDRDPDSQRYKNLIKLAGDWDAADAQAAKNLKARRQIDAIVERAPRDQEALDQRDEDNMRRLQDEQKFKFSDSYYAELKKNLKEIKILQDDMTRTPANTERNTGLIDQLNTQLAQRRDAEIANQVVIEQQKTIAVEQSLMTADQARESSHQRDMARLNEYLKLMGDSDTKLRGIIEGTIARSQAAYARATAAASPIAKSMKEWADVSNNLQKSAASWLDSTTDKMADFVVTGKAAWADLSNAILKDMAKMAIRGVAGNFYSFLGGGAGKAAGGGGGASKMVAQHHSGGTAGSVGASRMVDPAMFANAPRWHTGTGGMTLGGDEIPIIAKRGEQVDWPENLAKQYGGAGGGVTLTMGDINVNGGSGTPAQNDDLVAKMTQAFKDSAQEMVTAQIRKQMKPGGLLKG
jgi:tape measure domain-containing protein